MNPVVETFGELFKPLEEARKAEAEWEAEFARQVEKAQPKNPFGLFSQEMFEEALQMAQFFPGVVVKAPGDTIHYATPPLPGDTFVPPEAWTFTVPQPPPVKRFRKRKR